MKGRVISVINMKGGVAKTTLCLGIGEYLANFRNKKILFIDIDPQFNLTQSLLSEFNLEDQYLEDYSKNKTIKKLLESRATLMTDDGNKMLSKEDVIIELNENIDMIAGTIDLILEDNAKDAGKVKKIKRFIRENKLKEIYDYILIDCPPTITLYTDAALYASDYYLVPNRIDRYSILGIKLLKQVIDRLIADEELDIKPLGIVHTMLDIDTKKTGLLRTQIEQASFVKEIGLFNNHTSNVRDLLVGLSGNIASKYSKSREDIEKIVDEFIIKIDNMKKKEGN